MKKMTGFSLAVAATLLLSGNAMALPSAGDTIQVVGHGLGTTGGGEFYIDVLGKGTYVDYTGFCLEINESIDYFTTYTVDSVTDYAENGGVGGAIDNKDLLDEKTKWVYWNYIHGVYGFNNSTADAVQNIIWYLEEEITSLGSYQAQYNAWFDGKTDFTIWGNVKVLNLSDATGLKQSQIIGDPVPEPTTMLLFGTGLLGLAGFARRRKNI